MNYQKLERICKKDIAILNKTLKIFFLNYYNILGKIIKVNKMRVNNITHFF